MAEERYIQQLEEQNETLTYMNARKDKRIHGLIDELAEAKEGKDLLEKIANGNSRDNCQLQVRISKLETMIHVLEHDLEETRAQAEEMAALAGFGDLKITVNKQMVDE